MVSRINDKLDSTRKMLRFRRTQLEQTAKYIKKRAKQNREDLSKKYSAHIQALEAFFEDYKRRESEVLNEALVFQENRIEDVTVELNE